VSANNRKESERPQNISPNVVSKGISGAEAAIMAIISDKDLLKNVLKGDKGLREGRVLNHKEVFGT